MTRTTIAPSRSRPLALEATPRLPVVDASAEAEQQYTFMESPKPYWSVEGLNLYLIGIGGCGMSGLARMLCERGAAVSGSDTTPSAFTRTLADEGFTVGFDQSVSLPEACDFAIASAAVKPDHPQVLDAERRGIEVLTYAEALGKCMHGTTGIAVAGVHGKSTTSAMLGWALTAGGLDPTVIVGANCPQLGGGFRLGADRIPEGPYAGAPGILVAEACEYNRSFHNYRPRLAAITSVEADHLDIYGTLDAVVDSFRDFARYVPPNPDVTGEPSWFDSGPDGTLLIAHQGAHRREISAGLQCRVLTIGFAPAADFHVRFDPSTRETSLHRRDAESPLARWISPLPGEHNAMNAAMAVTLATLAGTDPAQAAAAVERFTGLARRTQFLGECPLPAGGAIRVYDDYGHHPTEVEATLQALRDHERPDLRGGRMIVVFQPHQHSRTRFLLDEFASAFSAADTVIVPEIYFVRDSIAERQKVSASDLVDRLRDRGAQAMHLHPFEAIVEQLENICRPNDVLVVMGAGPVDQVAYGFLDAMSRTGAESVGADETPLPRDGEGSSGSV